MWLFLLSCSVWFVIVVCLFVCFVLLVCVVVVCESVGCSFAIAVKRVGAAASYSTSRLCFDFSPLCGKGSHSEALVSCSSPPALSGYTSCVRSVVVVCCFSLYICSRLFWCLTVSSLFCFCLFVLFRFFLKVKVLSKVLKSFSKF